MIPSLARLNELKTEYTEKYQYHLDRVGHYANSNDSNASIGLRMTLREAREARAMLKVIQEAIERLGA
jgi:hypothetical protein